MQPSGSAIWDAIGWTGSRLVIGFWNTMAMSRPRIAQSAFSSRARRSRPANVSRVADMLAGGDGKRRMIARQSTDLPLPDSPTMPSVSPAPIASDTE